VASPSRLRRELWATIADLGHLNRNVQLLLLATVLTGISQGIFGVNFNLYILTLGIQPDTLGTILSAAPFAHALASIPVGFLGERLGFRKTFTAIYALAGLAQVSQVATGHLNLIILGSFLTGLAFSGDFVVRLPFLASNSDEGRRMHIFGASSVLNSASYALGSLIAGYLPNVLGRFVPDLATSYRYTLFVAAGLTLIAIAPALFITDAARGHSSRISLHPYLWGIDRFTVKVASVELFLGLTMGLMIPFMNLIYIFRLGTSREFFSNVAALALFPTLLATVLAPTIASRVGRLGAVTLARLLVPVTTLTMALTTNPYVGTVGYWGYRALFVMSQAIWFAYVMDSAHPRAKAAASAWLEIAFWVGQGLAALATGAWLARSSYTLPFYAATVAALIAGLLSLLCAAPPPPKPKAHANGANG